jgi:hypothetical protein
MNKEEKDETEKNTWMKKLNEIEHRDMWPVSIKVI